MASVKGDVEVIEDEGEVTASGAPVGVGAVNGEDPVEAKQWNQNQGRLHGFPKNKCRNIVNTQWFPMCQFGFENYDTQIGVQI